MSTAFDRHLASRGLLPSTQEKYVEILDSAPENPRELLAWVRQRLRPETPIGTVLPTRAAVKHYLVAVHGYDPVDVDSLLPEARGRTGQMRQALLPHQLALYHAAVEGVRKEPARTILALLPLTGLRISEICSLQRRHLVRHGSGLAFALDEERVLPLPANESTALLAYLDSTGRADQLFSGIGPHGVRKYTRQLASEYPELVGLSPAVLRHTYGVMALRSGLSLQELKARMGFRNVSSAERYL